MTTAQLATLKAAITGDNAINTTPQGSDGAFAIAVYLNTIITSPATFFVYRSNVPVQEIYNQITWASLTPTDSPDATVQWQNRAIACQGKQFNLQIILQGQDTIDASRAAVRAGLQDALTNVPAGAAGALISAGWTGVRDNALARAATRFEKIFATGGNGTTAALAATMGLEGPVAYQDVQTARES